MVVIACADDLVPYRVPVRGANALLVSPFASHALGPSTCLQEGVHGFVSDLACIITNGFQRRL
jgi:hypothetical protein